MAAAIRTLDFSDPDDALRLVQVRDWVAGQSWFDVTQYRSQAPGGASMHWSRLVDVPIAGIIWLAGLVVSPVVAEQVGLVAVPLLVLLLLFGILYKITVRLSGRRVVGVMASVMLPLSMGVLVQFQPLRVDHHGWQITLGAVGVLFLLGAVGGSRRQAVFAGLVSAVALAVAVEGLPLVVGMAGVLGFREFRYQNARFSLLLDYLAALSVGAVLLPLATVGWPEAAVPWCDALSPAYLFPIVTATAALAIGRRFLPQSMMAGRVLTLGIAGAAAAIVFRTAAPQCAAGPFATLDPLVYALWYRSIAEGMPLWFQEPDIWILVPVPSILGLIGVVWAMRRDQTDQNGRREPWIAMLILQSVTCIVSLFVMRSMGMAHLLSIPATAMMLLSLFAATRRLSTPVRRVAAGVAWVAITPIGIEAILLSLVPGAPPPVVGNRNGNSPAYTASGCVGQAKLSGLRAIPPAILFTPLDIGPHLLAFTRHSVIATGHHRARWGMKTVITGMIAPPEQARTIMTGTAARYLAFCAGENEVQKYAKRYPASITASLLQGRTPGWLQPVAMPRGETIRVYRILRPASAPAAASAVVVQPAAKRIATPFMQ